MRSIGDAEVQGILDAAKAAGRSRKTISNIRNAVAQWLNTAAGQATPSTRSTRSRFPPVIGHSKSMDTHGVYGHDFDGFEDETAATLDAIFRELLAEEQSG